MDDSVWGVTVSPEGMTVDFKDSRTVAAYGDPRYIARVEYRPDQADGRPFVITVSVPGSHVPDDAADRDYVTQILGYIGTGQTTEKARRSFETGWAAWSAWRDLVALLTTPAAAEDDLAPLVEAWREGGGLGWLMPRLKEIAEAQQESDAHHQRPVSPDEAPF